MLSSCWFEDSAEAAAKIAGHEYSLACCLGTGADNLENKKSKRSSLDTPPLAEEEGEGEEERRASA